MLRSLGAGAVLATLAGPALSLSCLMPHMGERYNMAAESEAVYVLAEGRLSSAAPLPEIPQPGPVEAGPREHVIVSALLDFSGRHLGIAADGDLQAPVTVEIGCIASWCGDFPALEERALFFFRRDAEKGLVLDAGACPGEVFPAPTARQINVLRSCMQNGLCGAAELSELNPY